MSNPPGGFVPSNRHPRDASSAIRWQNVSGESIPAYGVYRIDDFDASLGHFDALKPDGEEGLYYVNGPVPVADTKYGGSQTWDFPRRVLVDSNSLTIGQEVGPVSGSWAMTAEGTGFRIFRPPASLVAVVERIGGGSPLLHAITTRCLGTESTGWYVVELTDGLHSEPADDVPDPDIPPGEDGTCDRCTFDSVDYEVTCGSAGASTVNRGSPTGNGIYVFAYDKRIVPLRIGGPVTIAYLGDTKTTVGGEVKLYTVIDGEREIVKLPHEVWECCDDGAGNKTIRRTNCKTFFFEGWFCDTPEDPCP